MIEVTMLEVKMNSEATNSLATAKLHKLALALQIAEFNLKLRALSEDRLKSRLAFAEARLLQLTIQMEQLTSDSRRTLHGVTKERNSALTGLTLLQDAIQRSR